MTSKHSHMTFKMAVANPQCYSTPGLLVHPKYGPVVPDGRNTKLDNRIGYVKNATPLDRTKWP